MSISYPQSDPNVNGPRSADAPDIHLSEGRAGRTDDNQLNAEPSDPPSASPSPLRGQVETNQPLSADETAALHADAIEERAFQEAMARRSSAAERDAADLTAQRAAFDLGWQGFLQHGRQQAMPEAKFENVETELAQLWRLKEALQPQQLPWEEAKETARDAWDRVRDALTGG